jgi:hypothetical protein
MAIRLMLLCVLCFARLSAEDKIETEILWKQLMLIDKESQTLTVNVWYRSPKPGFAYPKLYFINDNDEQVFSMEMKESAWIRDNVYSIEFTTRMKFIKGFRFMMESNTKEPFLDVQLIEIKDKPK